MYEPSFTTRPTFSPYGGTRPSRWHRVAWGPFVAFLALLCLLPRPTAPRDPLVEGWAVPSLTLAAHRPLRPAATLFASNNPRSAEGGTAVRSSRAPRPKPPNAPLTPDPLSTAHINGFEKNAAPDTDTIDWWARFVQSENSTSLTPLPVAPEPSANSSKPNWFTSVRRPVVRWVAQGWLKRFLVGDAELIWEVFEIRRNIVTLQLRVDLKATNFNAFGVELTRLDTRLYMKSQGNNTEEFWICDGKLAQPVTIDGKKITTISLQFGVKYNMFTEADKTQLLTRVVQDCTNKDLASLSTEALETQAPHFRIEIAKGEVRIAGFPVDLPSFNVTRSITRPVDLTSFFVKVLVHPKTRIVLFATTLLSLVGLFAWTWVSWYGTPDPFPRLLILWPDQTPELLNVTLPQLPLEPPS
jgi:hypothetical protein